MHIDKAWFGRPITLIEANTPSRVAFITRLGEGMIPNEHTVLQEGDLVHVMVAEKDVEITEMALSKSPESK
jgi:trk system potassium uptake protein TrkA